MMIAIDLILIVVGACIHLSAHPHVTDATLLKTLHATTRPSRHGAVQPFSGARLHVGTVLRRLPKPVDNRTLSSLAARGFVGPGPSPLTLDEATLSGAMTSDMSVAQKWAASLTTDWPLVPAFRSSSERSGSSLVSRASCEAEVEVGEAEELDEAEDDDRAEEASLERKEPAHLARSAKVPLKSSRTKGVVKRLSAGVTTPGHTVSERH